MTHVYTGQFLHWIRGHSYTRRLILQPISAACPRIDVCTKNPPPCSEHCCRVNNQGQTVLITANTTKLKGFCGLSVFTYCRICCKFWQNRMSVNLLHVFNTILWHQKKERHVSPHINYWDKSNFKKVKKNKQTNKQKGKRKSSKMLQENFTKTKYFMYCKKKSYSVQLIYPQETTSFLYWNIFLKKKNKNKNKNKTKNKSKIVKYQTKSTSSIHKKGKEKWKKPFEQETGFFFSFLCTA